MSIKPVHFLTSIAESSPEDWADEKTALCPACGVPAGFNMVGSCRAGSACLENKIIRHVFVLCCRSCNEAAIAISYLPDLQDSPAEVSGKLVWQEQRWPDRAPDELEDPIRKSYNEARIVLPYSPASSAMLARRCLQMIIRERLNIVKRTLSKEIEAAIEKSDLSSTSKEGLHSVREIGNDAAHPNTDQSGDVSEEDAGKVFIEVSRADAEFTLEVLEILFEDVYIRPKKMAEMKAKIDLRRGRDVTVPTVPTDHS